MAVVEVRRRVKANKRMVWSIVSDLTGDSTLPPAAKRADILRGAELGLTRRVTGGDGRVWQEECVGWDSGKLYSVVISGDFPVGSPQLRYTCSLVEEAGSVLIRLYFDFIPRFGLVGRLIEGVGGRRELQVYATDVLDNWVRIVHAREWVYRVTARRILEEKGGHVHSVGPKTPVREVAAVLKKYRIGTALVLDGEQKIAGVLSERDIVRGIAASGAGLLEQSADTIMTREVITADPDDNMMSVMACMTECRIRHLPVVEYDQVLGLISIGDVIKARISELEGQSETLLDYIKARHWHELYKEVGPAAYAES